MRRRQFLTTLIAASLSAAPLLAQTPQDAIVAQLAEQGFTEIRIGHTLLGRVRIVATSEDYRRELVFNPRTGEILRDLWADLEDGTGVVQIASPDDVEKEESGGSSGGAGEDDDDDDREDDGEDGGDDERDDERDDADDRDEDDDRDDEDRDDDRGDDDDEEDD